LVPSTVKLLLREKEGKTNGCKNKKKKEKENYAGSKTLPASIKEKETHWPEVP
jgi:hypothetical protein